MAIVNLSEILHPKMDILFVALNPPETSNSNGHYFSRNMSFWNLLYSSGLITQAVKSPLMGDNEVFRCNNINYKNSTWGITDLVYDVVQTKSSRVKTNPNQVYRILELLKSHEVKNMCFMHSKVGEAFECISNLNRDQRYGLIGHIEDTAVYEIPFHNASIPDKHIEYKKLLKAL